MTNYLLERQQVGRNKWTSLGEIPGDPPSYGDREVDPGRRYCYRIRAKNAEGISDFLETEDIQAGVLCESTGSYRSACTNISLDSHILLD